MTEPPGTGFPPGMRKAWGLYTEGTRGPKPQLNLNRIVSTAVDLADQKGLAGLTMGALAKSLGFTPMALYRHVESKEELLVLAQDMAFGTPYPPAEATESWRDRLLRWAQNVAVRFREHPWLLDVPVSQMPSTPRQLLWFERLLEALSGTNLTASEKLGSALLINNLVTANSRVERDLTGNTSQQAGAADKAYLAVLFKTLSPDSYPEVLKVFSGIQQQPGEQERQEFMFGLQRVLDGLEMLMNGRQ